MTLLTYFRNKITKINHSNIIQNKNIDNSPLPDEQMSMLYGAVIGDIIGSKYEFNNIKHKDFPLFSKGCSYTDDTIMTIAVANALQNSWNNIDKFVPCLIQEMQRLGRKYPHPQGNYGRRFSTWLKNNNPTPYNSFGNGSAMRVSPCAIYAVELEEALKLAELSASVTHNHPEGIKGAKAVAAAIFLSKTGKSKTEIKNYIEQNYYKLNESIDAIRKYYTFNETCQGTVPQAITAFLESETFVDAIRNAVSIGGDTDTIAAITGSIAWSFYFDNNNPIYHELIYQSNRFLPQEFINTIIQFDKKSRARFSHYSRMMDSSEFKIYKSSRVGKDHSDTPEEFRTRTEISCWIMKSKLNDKILELNNTAEYYCITSNGIVFKKEKDIFYRLDTNNMIWLKDNNLISIWNGDGPIFKEYQNFEDYFPIK